MDKQELDKLIDKSILGTLTQNEKSQLEAYIMEQPTTKLEIKMRTDLMKGLEYNADQELKSILNKIHNEEISGKKHNGLLKKIGFSLLAISILIGAYAIFNYMNTSQEAKPIVGSAIYATYFEPFTPSLETRSSDAIQEVTYKQFIDAYRNKDYDKSLAIIKPLISNADNKTLLIAGISAMEIDKHQEAFEYFDKIITSNDFYFIDHAKWYKSLVLIKTNKINEAKVLLNDLANNPEADHHNESVSLLKEF